MLTRNSGIMRGYVSSVKSGEKVSQIKISIPRPKKDRSAKTEYDNFWLTGFYQMSEKLKEAKEVIIQYHLVENNYEVDGKRTNPVRLIIDELEVIKWKSADEISKSEQAAPKPTQPAYVEPDFGGGDYFQLSEDDLPY